MIIKKLAPHEAQKIAAGEVVERPANIIKELVENSIDAGSTKIMIMVQDGGKQGITITDNGSGMSAEDARICFERHTTSKIVLFNELSQLTTFGFRGEALASVCSVSKVTLTTRTHDADYAVQLHIEGGKVIKEQPISHSVGTSIMITDLFYNVPVRKKFLKTTATEWNQISNLFKAFCLVYPQIHFTLEHNNTVVYNCPRTEEVLLRAAQIFDTAALKALRTIEKQEHSSCTITGVISTAHYHRYDRQGIYLFVNKRWIKNFELSRALLKGYANVLPPNTYPYAFLSITVDPLLVDINVHPKKEEVVFVHPRLIEQQITTAVKTTLEADLSRHLQRPVTLAAQEQHHSHQALWATRTTPASFASPFSLSPKRIDPIIKDQPIQVFTQPITPPQAYVPQQEPVHHEQQENYLPEPEQNPYVLVGQLHTTYLLIEHPDGMLLIDQHAAHERILYEQYRQQFEHPQAVQLLFPLSVQLCAQEITLLESYIPLLKQHGFEIELFDTQSIIVTATPIFAKNINMQELVREVIGWIKEGADIAPDDLFKRMTEKLRAQLACKTAIKAGDHLTHEKMEELLKTLVKTENRFSCPHGRPTHWLLTTHDIEKKFKRVA